LGKILRLSPQKRGEKHRSVGRSLGIYVHEIPMKIELYYSLRSWKVITIVDSIVRTNTKMDSRKRASEEYSKKEEEMEERTVRRKLTKVEKVDWEVDRLDGFRLRKEGGQIIPQFHCVWAK